jgi:aryl-alcohol dehydrogenase-like predicted oxidoreductase
VVGKALKSIPRANVVIATKARVHRDDPQGAERVVASLDSSLRAMATDYVDVFCAQHHRACPGCAEAKG